jgi:hypothetical protein
MEARVTASSAAAGWEPAGAIDGDRFTAGPGAAWQGAAHQAAWWWRIDFGAPREVGAILQVNGDHAEILRGAPSRYRWQWSEDGRQWRDLPGMAVDRERRLFRVHRLPTPIRARFLQIAIDAAEGDAPTLRQVEVFSATDAAVSFDDWIAVVSTLEHGGLPGAGAEFIPLARSCPGWESLKAQQLWLADFDPEFVALEPRPLCAFFSGNFRDWCQVPREPWRGTQGVLREGRLPLWASCGGAQGLAILAETGVEHPWDCPHCRDPEQPRLPIYTHIGHATSAESRLPCGEYSACVFERGAHNVRLLVDDPAFAGLPREFSIMESHCGQIEWPPEGWELIVTGGEGAHTRTQCLRVRDRPIYAAQFHIEMTGTPENSRRIMANFLAMARSWVADGPRAVPSIDRSADP